MSRLPLPACLAMLPTMEARGWNAPGKLRFVRQSSTRRSRHARRRRPRRCPLRWRSMVCSLVCSGLSLIDGRILIPACRGGIVCLSSSEGSAGLVTTRRGAPGWQADTAGWQGFMGLTGTAKLVLGRRDCYLDDRLAVHASIWSAGGYAQPLWPACVSRLAGVTRVTGTGREFDVGCFVSLIRGCRCEDAARASPAPG